MQVRIADITHDSVVDGPGLRTVVWFSGCKHNCPECHNKELQDFNAGYSIEISELTEKLKGTRRITFSGGDPLYQLDALDEIVGLLDPGVDIWIYTGSLLQEVSSMLSGTRYLQHRDFTVKCGPYIKALRDTSTLYRGSNNQRIYYYHGGSFEDISEKIDRGD